jgi:hypothetical protein
VRVVVLLERVFAFLGSTPNAANMFLSSDTFSITYGAVVVSFTGPQRGGRHSSLILPFLS